MDRGDILFFVVMVLVCLGVAVGMTVTLNKQAEQEKPVKEWRDRVEFRLKALEEK